MLVNLIKQYNKNKMSIVQKLSEEFDLEEEIPFQDDEKISAEIERLKGIDKKIYEEIDFLSKYDKNDCEKEKKIKYLLRKRYSIIESIAFLASNNEKNIDTSLNIVKGKGFLLEPCLKALSLYYRKDHESAYYILADFLKQNGDFSKHFLLNKVYGKLLVQRQQYVEAKKYLFRAIKLRPEDVEIHKYLYEIHVVCNNHSSAKVEKEIIVLLEG